MGMKMWFGTEERRVWVPLPSTGADSSPLGSSTNGTLMGGGGFVAGSLNTHKQYVYAWSNASTRQAALLMQAYHAGAYGRGLIYFHDPLTFDTNILPKQWSMPSIALEHEAPTLLPLLDPPITETATADAEANNLPLASVTYDLAGIPHGFQGARNSLFIPVPPGFTLRLGAFYEATGSGGVWAAPVDAVGTAGTPVKLTEMANDATEIVPDVITPGTLGVRLWVGKSASGAATVTLAALIGRLVSSITPDNPIKLAGPWIIGEGNSGCRFVGAPTYIKYNGVGGGQVGYATTLKETGSWEY